MESIDLTTNIEAFPHALGRSSNLIVRMMKWRGRLPIAVLYMESLVKELPEERLTARNVSITEDFSELLTKLLTGEAIILLDGYSRAILVNVAG